METEGSSPSSGEDIGSVVIKIIVVVIFSKAQNRDKRSVEMRALGVTMPLHDAYKYLNIGISRVVSHF